jgi:hypothetical protein
LPPTVGRWTTTETVAAATAAADGIHVTVRATISDVVRENGWHDDPARLTPAQTLLLVRGNCVYQPRPPFRMVWASDDHPAFCFPLTAGGEFGRAPTTPPDEEDVWKIGAINGDPFGTPGGRTFRVYGFQGSGDTTDYWFQEGVGVVQFVQVHHGTYDEYRRRLVKTTIDGVTTTYALQPARTPPLDAGECRTGWQRWVRSDGTLLRDRAACEAYARSRRQPSD